MGSSSWLGGPQKIIDPIAIRRSIESNLPVELSKIPIEVKELKNHRKL
jgi:hypothetical protein